MAVRNAGRITEWNDDRGYGFVTPHEGGTRAFVHVKAFQAGSRRPVEGDLISYEAAKDSAGRTKAAHVRFAGQRIVSPGQRAPRSPAPLRHMPRRLLGTLVLLAIAAAAIMKWVPVVVWMAYWLISLVSFLVYWRDKDAAGAKEGRIPENTLHILDLLGGWPGALIAQQQFRHKTVKTAFQATFWITVLLNVAVVAFLARVGGVQVLMGTLLGR